MKDKARAHLIVSGKVQGVWYRAETHKAAETIGVTGWVKNKRDGTVEIVAEGENEQLASLITWCQDGSPLARVRHVKVAWEVYQAEFDAFTVRY